MRSIEIPSELQSDPTIVFVANISGGKDSAAVSIALHERGIEHLRVFADTAWEAPETYAHIERLEKLLGRIDRVGVPGGMLAVADKKAGFPHRTGRWCTEKLKIEPIHAYLDTLIRAGKTPVSVLGVRADESEARAAMRELEDHDRWGWVWRPILSWSVAEVIEAHREAGVPMNPLYLRGHDRVGCYPCIMSNKGDIRLLAEHAPDRIDLIRQAEADYSAERRRRNAAGEANFAHLNATFFMQKAPGVSTIDEVVAWSRTERGGRQLPMFPEPPDGGCFRWGLCEAPSSEDGA